MNRKIVNVLLIFFVLFTMYNTLIPFHFQFNGHSIKTFLQSIDWRLFTYRGRHTSLTDIAGNILLFMPLGFLLYLWLHQRRFRAAFLLTVVTGLLLSALIEFLQLFIKERTSSIIDLSNNTLGTFLGALTASIYFHSIARHINRGVRRLIQEQPATLLLLIFFVLQTMGSIFPFNVSITISDLINSIKHINIMPFQNWSLAFFLFHRPTGLDALAFNWFKFVENVLFWSVWGYISGLCYHAYWSMRLAGKWFLLVIGFMPAVLLEFLQIFIVSRYCDINDIISNWLGVFLGLVFYSLCLPNDRFTTDNPWRKLKGAVGLYFLFILFAGLRPFDFHFSLNSPLQAINLQMLIPFFSYFQNTNIWNVYDLISTLIYFIPISLYMSYNLYQRGRGWPSIFFLAALAGFLIGAFIEFFQLYSPTRVGEVTDALLYCMGGFLGTFSLYYIIHEVRPALDYH